MFYYTCFTNVSGVFNYTKLLDNSEYALHFMSLEQQEGKGYNTFTINHVKKKILMHLILYSLQNINIVEPKKLMV